ncbi:cytokine receptor common subunit gamma-like isoform X2 [Cheilinus undulatus]|uniref:cytokine receptor common subunit gamma-like isoform X2 n=1 Tax=Cheilinus undulatus TaxID=241271 RepID=UPI001BD60F6A|nr:cytokine receptor common subunit gamma-like isoform X2 [Cheilinus undulatus]
MSIRLCLFFCLIGPVLAKQLPDVDCVVVHLQYVQCLWNKLEAPQGNYTFYGWFFKEKKMTACARYLSENGTNIGCNQPYTNLINRFHTFTTTLVDGSNNRTQTHDLKNKVILYPPTNVTIKMEPDSNLWLYWNQTNSSCVESRVSYRINNNEWETTQISVGKQSHCINLPCSHCRYEAKVQSRMDNNCARSDFWSGWSEPVVWGSNNSTDPSQTGSMFVWTPVLIGVGFITLILLVMVLLHHERIRIILIPVVPKPALTSHNIEDWLEKGLKQSFKPNYNERACTVREYTQVSQSDSESSASSTSSVTTDQTDCSISTPTNEPDPALLPAPQF